jgi:CHAD domain-containing protein
MLKNHSLSHSLKKTWQKYSQQVHAARKNLSIKNIHQLRITTQQLEALLTLADALKSTKHSKNIIYLVKKVRKSLGPLRDIQVESTALKKMKEKRFKMAKHKEFFKFFLKQKNKSKKKALKCLDEISLKHEKNQIDNLTQKLVAFENKNNKKKMNELLTNKLKKSVMKLNTFMKDVDPKEVKEIHQFRVQAKKIRYQAECLNTTVGDSHFNLKNLKNVQSVAGRIQNDSVLIGTIDKFLSKRKHENDVPLLNIRKLVANNQAVLINTNFKKMNTLKSAREQDKI